MNIEGIKILRKLDLPAPKKEIITHDLSEVDLEDLYNDAKKDVTILAFDSNEPANQNPLLEKNVRKYKIKKEEYFAIRDKLIENLIEKGVKKEDIVFLTHQTYTPEDIKYSGRIAIHIDDYGNGDLMIDGVESLRKANTDFSASFVYRCPIRRGRVCRADQEIIQKDFDFPEELIERLIQDVLYVHKHHINPCMDFEVYAKCGTLFYHDMFLGRWNS